MSTSSNSKLMSAFRRVADNLSGRKQFVMSQYESTLQQLLAADNGDSDGDVWTNLYAPKVLESESGREALRRLGADSTYLILLESQRRIAAANSTVFLNNYGEHSDHFIVQHRGTGLRLNLNRYEGYVWSLDAKPYGGGYSLTSKHQDNEAKPVIYAGLGVGKRLYREAASLDSSIRYRDFTVNESSAAVRRTVHRENPHQFEDRSCLWCNDYEGKRIWTRADFVEVCLDHP